VGGGGKGKVVAKIFRGKNVSDLPNLTVHNSPGSISYVVLRGRVGRLREKKKGSEDGVNQAGGRELGKWGQV